MGTVLFPLVTGHLTGCGLHGYSLVSFGNGSPDWLWPTWVQSCFLAFFKNSNSLFLFQFFVLSMHVYACEAQRELGEKSWQQPTLQQV